MLYVFVFQAEDGIRDLVRSRGLGDVYKRQESDDTAFSAKRIKDLKLKDTAAIANEQAAKKFGLQILEKRIETCLLYTSDAADERSSVDLGGRRIIKKKKK